MGPRPRRWISAAQRIEQAHLGICKDRVICSGLRSHRRNGLIQKTYCLRRQAHATQQRLRRSLRCETNSRFVLMIEAEWKVQFLAHCEEDHCRQHKKEEASSPAPCPLKGRSNQKSQSRKGHGFKSRPGERKRYGDRPSYPNKQENLP